MELAFRPDSSYIQVALSCLLHLAAIVAIVISALPTALLLLMIPLLCVDGFIQIRQATLSAGSALAIVHADKSGILLELRNRRKIPVTIINIYCISWLQVVAFSRTAGRLKPTYWLVVLPDSAGHEPRRWLRSWLLSVPMRQSKHTS